MFVAYNSELTYTFCIYLDRKLPIRLDFLVDLPFQVLFVWFLSPVHVEKASRIYWAGSLIKERCFLLVMNWTLRPWASGCGLCLKNSRYIDIFTWFDVNETKYLLLTEVEGRTVSYGPSFFPFPITVRTKKTRLVMSIITLLCLWRVRERFLFTRNGFKSPWQQVLIHNFRS